MVIEYAASDMVYRSWWQEGKTMATSAKEKYIDFGCESTEKYQKLP